jgi:hypothetical protein
MLVNFSLVIFVVRATPSILSPETGLVGGLEYPVHPHLDLDDPGKHSALPG